MDNRCGPSGPDLNGCTRKEYAGLLWQVLLWDVAIPEIISSCPDIFEQTVSPADIK